MRRPRLWGGVSAGRGTLRRLLNRAIARFVPDVAIVAVAMMRRHKAEFGVFPNFIWPKTFNEKVQHRILFDRRPIWIRLQDKYAVREYVTERIGAESLTKLHWVTQDPSDIPFDDLPPKFVVKPTHGSGWVVLVPDKARVNRAELVETCRSWLAQNYYDAWSEWAYKRIEPRIIIEEFIDDGTGPIAVRYQLHVFDGMVGAIQVLVGKRGESRHDFYGRSWNMLPGTRAGKKHIDPPPARPKHLDEMIRYAEILGDGLDFVRVDLFDTPEKVYFGELTITPGAGNLRYAPDEFDRFLGGLWKRSSRRRARRSDGGWRRLP